MVNNRTLAILKPDCIEKNLSGSVIESIQHAGFKILAFKMIRMSKSTAGCMYEVHKEKSFFKALLTYMTSGPCIPIVLEKNNAVVEFRKLIGATDPKNAADGTIRKMFAQSKRRNIIHGSDSNKNAAREISIFFTEREIIEINGYDSEH